jgi:predicted ATPase with chaperone activity
MVGMKLAQPCRVTTIAPVALPIRTARSIDRLIKVARTCADLEEKDEIDADCLYEAAGFRDVDPAADALLIAS